MNIKEALSKYEPTVKVKIGCIDGEGYWWAGHVADIDTAEMDSKIVQSLSGAVKRSEIALKNHLYRAVTPEFYLKKELARLNPSPTVQGYMDELKNYFAAGVRIQATLVKRQQALENYKPILSREVKVCEPSDRAADDCVRVMLEGTESGRLWFTDEAEKLPSFWLPSSGTTVMVSVEGGATE